MVLLDLIQSHSYKTPMATLTVVTPFYNEEHTLQKSIERVLAIADESLSIEIIIVDDCSTDGSHAIAEALKVEHPEVRLVTHDANQGKGAALRAGIAHATGDFLAIHDADLEYDPQDLKRLVVPLIEGKADVVFGSRFMTGGAHRVLFFWHQLGNQFLTLLSNMFTDLNLTDMETCYKVFRMDVIQAVTIEEDRFGFEPEIVAKIAAMRLRIFEMGISYFGRTYEEGKKIGLRDGFRALYCILRYNAHRAPLPIQFLFYILIGGTAAVINLATFLLLYQAGVQETTAALSAFWIAAAVNYLLCILLLFRHQARWNTQLELFFYLLVVSVNSLIDTTILTSLMRTGFSPISAKLSATAVSLVFNFLGRRFIVFPEASSGPWKPQHVFNGETEDDEPQDAAAVSVEES